jgi:anti-anti-sigma factor
MRDHDHAPAARTSGALVVEIRGELDIATVLRWTTVLEAAICELPGPHLLVVDLGQLEFLSARGAAGLVEAFDLCRERDIEGCLIAGAATSVGRVLHLTGLDRRVPVFPDRLSAIAASQPEQMRWLQTLR